MPIYPKKSEYDLAPEGLHIGVCCDVTDLGLIPGFGNKLQHKVKLTWQIDQENPRTQRRFTVSRRYTLSCHERGTLRKDLELWRGKKFLSEEDMAQLDLEKLIGATCQIQIAHVIREGGANYANVIAVLAAPKGVSKMAVMGYTRESLRSESSEAIHGRDIELDDDDEVPF